MEVRSVETCPELLPVQDSVYQLEDSLLISNEDLSLQKNPLTSVMNHKSDKPNFDLVHEKRN